MGIPTLKELFEERYYSELSGGILESFGRMFKNDLKLYVYPFKDPTSGAIITAGNLRVAPHLRHLYLYLMENFFIQPMRDVNEANMLILSRTVLRMLQDGEAGWEDMVPGEVAALIKERKLLGCTTPPMPSAATVPGT
jgi:hypothetical protein